MICAASELPDGTVILRPAIGTGGWIGGVAAALRDRSAQSAPGRVVIVLTGGSVQDAKVGGTDAPDADTAEAMRAIDDLTRQTIAVMQGRMTGAALALALTCDHRLATADMVIDLPEVRLGSIPRHGILFRLAHLVGPAATIRLVCDGRPVGADQAARTGLVDAVADGDAVAVEAAPRLPLADRRPSGEADGRAIDEAAAAVRRRMPGQAAPETAVALIQAAATQSPDEAERAERAAHISLAGGMQAAALRHIAKAEARAAASDSGRRVSTAVVVGGGTMGASIAHAMTLAGIAVTIVETGAAAVSRAQGNVAALRDQTTARGIALGPWPEVVAGYDALPDADIAVEAAFEDMGVKQAIFAQLAATLTKRTVLATNTSYLDVNRIADGIPHPDRMLGLHFFSPAHVMRLVEIVRADATSDDTLALAYGLAAQLGKIPVAAGICDGFIGNRILTRYRQTTDVMLLEGALPWEIDCAMQDFGMAMGPYAVQDLSGLDIAYANRRRLSLKDNPAYRYVPIADRMVEDLNRLGRKTAAGWYDHAEGRSVPSPVVAGLIETASAEAGLTRRGFADTDIQDRALTAMADEACRILDQGIAGRPSDIDLVMVHGYGFPRWRGGLMHYADGVGMDVFLDRVRQYRAQDPLSWSEGQLMARLVAEGRSLSDMN